MPDMGSKVIYTIVNDKFKVKCFFLLSLNLEVESYFVKIYFLPSQINKRAVQFPSSPSSFPHHNWRHENAQESSVIQVNIERKKLAFSFKKQTVLKGQSTKEFFS